MSRIEEEEKPQIIPYIIISHHRFASNNPRHQTLFVVAFPHGAGLGVTMTVVVTVTVLMNTCVMPTSFVDVARTVVTDSVSAIATALVISVVSFFLAAARLLDDSAAAILLTAADSAEIGIGIRVGRPVRLPSNVALPYATGVAEMDANDAPVASETLRELDIDGVGMRTTGENVSLVAGRSEEEDVSLMAGRRSEEEVALMGRSELLGFV